MPRYILKRPKYKQSERELKSRKYRVWGYKGWIDPFPNVIGTVPEKMVYAALSYRGIPFWFQDEVNFAIPDLDFSKDFRPDIVLPTLHTIIEVQGAYWHTKPATIDADAYKDAVYEQAGWRVLNWWDFDIIDNVNKLFAADPQLSQYSVIQDYSTETSNGRKIIRDDTKGINTLNQKRATRSLYKKPTVKIKGSRRKTYYGKYATIK